MERTGPTRSSKTKWRSCATDEHMADKGSRSASCSTRPLARCHGRSVLPGSRFFIALSSALNGVARNFSRRGGSLPTSGGRSERDDSLAVGESVPVIAAPLVGLSMQPGMVFPFRPRGPRNSSPLTFVTSFVPSEEYLGTSVSLALGVRAGRNAPDHSAKAKSWLH